MIGLLDELITVAAADRTAIRFLDATITYGDLDRRADAIAHQLVELGVRRGNRVAVYQPKSVETVAIVLGILRAGAAYVPIDPAAPVERARFVMAHCAVDFFFTNGRPKKLCLKAEPSLAPTMLEPASSDRPRPTVKRSPDDLAYILYTSGSTGAPKGVAVTHRQSLTFVRGANQVFGLTQDDILSAHAPFNFDLSIIDLFCAFAAAATVHIVPEKWVSFPAKVAEIFSAVSVWNSVPSALVQLLDRGALAERDLSGVRLVMFAGEPIPTRALRALKKLLPGATLMNVYGQTEANSSTYHVVDDIEDPLPIGTPFPNYEVLLLDAAGAAAEEGEIYVVSDAVASGYFEDAARTSRAFVAHPLQPETNQIVYRTGDRARRDELGRLLFLGRTDSAIKVRGYRVELGELEGVAKRAPGVTDAAAIAVPDEEAGHRLFVFVVGDVSRVKPTMATHLPKYMLPERVDAVDALPRTGTGKVDRRALAALLVP